MLCPACRATIARKASGTEHQHQDGSTQHPHQHRAPSTQHAAPRPLCFQCYRAELDRERALKAAGQLHTASEARFQTQLPFEPVDRPRLEMLKVERAEARAAAVIGAGRFVDTRRHAQIEARHALQRIADGLRTRAIAPPDRRRAMADAIHAAELQLPEAWLPFVVSR